MTKETDLSGMLSLAREFLGSDFAWLSDVANAPVYPGVLASGTMPLIVSRAVSQAPAAQVRETDSEYVVTMKLPGLAKKDVKVIAYPHKLSVWSQVRQPAEKNDVKSDRVRFTRLEEFKRVIALQRPIDVKSVTAAFDGPELKISLPKKTEDGVRVVPIAPFRRLKKGVIPKRKYAGA